MSFGYSICIKRCKINITYGIIQAPFHIPTCVIKVRLDQRRGNNGRKLIIYYLWVLQNTWYPYDVVGSVGICIYIR